jgi:hypothetical protein
MGTTCGCERSETGKRSRSKLFVSVARAATALEKAMYQTVGEAREAGRSWTEIGNALGVTKQTAWQRFADGLRHPITGEQIDRAGESDA